MSLARTSLARRWAPMLGLVLVSLCFPVIVVALLPVSIGTGVRARPIAPPSERRQIEMDNAIPSVTTATPIATTNAPTLRADVSAPDPSTAVSRPTDDGSEAYVVHAERPAP